MHRSQTLSVIIILSIAVMLSFSILPAYAFDNGSSACPGEKSNGKSPWIRLSPGDEFYDSDVDVNGNNHICLNTKSGKVMDDRIPPF